MVWCVNIHIILSLKQVHNSSHTALSESVRVLLALSHDVRINVVLMC